MPTFSFVVDSYKCRLDVQRAGNPVVTTRSRVIEIVSQPDFHGIITRALLSFSTRWDAWINSPVAGYYDISTPLAPRLTGWLPSSEFPLFYDLIRSEKPVLVSYDITPINGANYVGTISLGTSTEVVGEGPRDFSP